MADQPSEDAVSSVPEGRSVLELIRDIKSGSIEARLLSSGDRQACVAHLTGEGLSVAEIARILKCSDRTISRDRKVIQERNALEHDVRLAGRMAGRLVTEAELCLSHIRRVARDRDTSPAVRVEAERICFQISSDLVQRLQGLGFLPQASQRLQAELIHRCDAPPGYDELAAELQLVQKATKQLPSDDGMSRQLSQLGEQIHRGRLAQEVAEAAGQLKTESDCDPT